MMDNKELIQKADLQLSDLASGGLLKEEQAQRFMRILIDESRLLKFCTVIPMKGPKRIIDQVTFGSRIMRAGTSGAALSSADRSKPDLSKVELDCQLIKGEVRLPYEVLEDNIERDTFRQTVIELLGQRGSLDVEELIVQGDTTSADTYLKVLNGIIKQATSHPVDHADAYIDKDLLRDMLLAMPKQYVRNKRALRYFTSTGAEIRWRDTLSERATTVGDKFLEQDAPTMYSGVPVVDLGTFPENVGTGSHCTHVILTDPKNVHVGIERNITIETDKDISAGEYIIVVSMRVDVKYAVEDAVVNASNVKV